MEERNTKTNVSPEMSKEKKKTITFTVILAVIAVALLSVLVVDKLKEEGIIASAESKQILKEVDEYLDSKGRKVIYYTSSSCSYCVAQTPILESLDEEYDIDYLSVDTSKLSKGQKRKLAKKLNIEHATPTTIIIEDGKVIDSHQGYLEGSEYVAFLKEEEILPEDAQYGAEKFITFVDYEEYEELINSKDTNIIVVGQTSCPHCQAIKPALNSVAEDYDITINYLNLTDISEDENGSFFDSLKTIGYDDKEFLEEGSIGTPLTLIVKNGKVSSYFSGEKTTSQLVREFKKLGLISE